MEAVARAILMAFAFFLLIPPRGFIMYFLAIKIVQEPPPAGDAS